MNTCERVIEVVITGLAAAVIGLLLWIPVLLMVSHLSQS